MRTQARLPALLAILCCAFAWVPATANEQEILSVMHSVLAGHAALAKSDLAAQTPSALGAKLDIELTDMASGHYATTGNRAFAELKPLWQRARQNFVAARQPPSNHLPDVVLALPEQTEQLFIADVSRNVAWLLQVDGAEVVVADAFYISIGRAGPGKVKRGDRKTPLGVYFVTGELDTQRLPARYGNRALPLDYPNALDRTFGRTGDGIWLHGMEPANNVRPPRDTDGCIALANDRIETLADIVQPWQTPVLVLDSVRWQPRQMRSPLADVLRAQVHDWAAAWASGDADQYLGYYAEDFTRDDMSPQSWRSFRRAALTARSIETVTADDVGIVLIDADRGIYLTRFSQALGAGDGQSQTGQRRLYWQKIDSHWRIVAEQTG